MTDETTKEEQSKFENERWHLKYNKLLKESKLIVARMERIKEKNKEYIKDLESEKHE